MEPLVSLITPCYNVEPYIDRFFESIFVQTYSNVEIIVINDGSTDNTEEKCLKWKEMFIKRGYSFIYHSKENGGAASAINIGLKIFKGDYLIWPDSDDTLMPDSIRKRVLCLDSHSDCGLVRGDVQIVNNNQPSKALSTTLDNKRAPESNIFFPLLNGEIKWYSHQFMVRRSAILDCIPNRHIYESRHGQNAQILLPITYKYKCAHINEILSTYYKRKDSHSNNVNENFEGKVKRVDQYEDIFMHVFQEMNISKDIIRYMHSKFLRSKLAYAAIYQKPEHSNRFYKELKRISKLTIKDFLLFTVSQNTLLGHLCVLYINHKKR